MVFRIMQQFIKPITGNLDENREGDSGLEVDWFWFFVSMALGFIVSFWSVVGPLVGNRRWRHAYFNFLHRLSAKFGWV